MDVEVRITDSLKGKGLYAKKDFPKDAVIFQEDPLVSCQFSWNAEYKYLACDHCLRPLETAHENATRLAGHPMVLPYPECCSTDKSKIVSCPHCSTKYCSEECRVEAYSQYHNTLCHENNSNHPLERLNDAWKKVHYPPETNSIMLIVRLLARIRQAPNRDAAIAQTLQFCHRTINEDADLAHKLLGDKFADQLSLLHSSLVAAIPNDGIEQFLTYEGFLSMLALIGTNGQGVGTSAIAQWVANTEKLNLPESEKELLDNFIEHLYLQMDENVGEFLNNEGVALYSLQSSCNHSCVPNAEPKFVYNNHRLSLVATRDIKEGEEIHISYLDECALGRSRHSRRKELMKHYLFMCQCPRCESEADEQPDVTSEEEDEEDDVDEEMSD
ncbi:protein-lysine N-trimethyltransferase SMYD5 [Diabrotica undecimpunctata]|uniref:protein-lysine N-trimethyltransferase SMYD5 n=1 Tax=Diabrotica undecimpunctata TaxID=50387 RepID=UPI003B63BE32